MLAFVGLQAFDAAGPDRWQFLVFGVPDGAGGAGRPILGRFPHFDGLSHAVLNALGVLAGVPFRMVPDKNRLTQGDVIRDVVNRGPRLVRVPFAFVAIVLEALGAFLGAIDKAAIFVANLVAKLDQQIFPRWRPRGSNEKLLFWCPRETCRLHAVVKVLGQA